MSTSPTKSIKSIDPQQCDFLLMRYVPDPFRNEFVNIGVLMTSRDEQFADVRFTRDWSRVLCIDPQADTDILNDLESDIRSQFQTGKESRRQIVSRLQDTLSNSLQTSEPSAILSAAPSQDLEQLARTYLERPRPRRESRLGARQRVFAKMQSAFEAAGVWDALHKNISAAKYTHPGDPLKLDCGYQPNGVVRLFHAISLASDPNSAKVLAFSYPALSGGILRLEKAKTHLNAVVEDNLDANDEGVQFALETFRQSSIDVVPLSDMPGLAERARVELRL